VAITLSNFLRSLVRYITYVSVVNDKLDVVVIFQSQAFNVHNSVSLSLRSPLGSASPKQT
jgi:hypothetical protein